MNKIKKIIDKYRRYEELYEVLQKIYIENTESNKDETQIINKIKKIIVSYYLFTYKFKTYSDGDIQDTLLINILRLCNLSKKLNIKMIE